MATARVGDVDLFYEITGEGDPLVLVNGGFLDHFMWLFVVPALAESFKVVTFDARGHGLSGGDLASAEPFQVVEDLAGLIENLGLAPVHGVGQSAGAQFLLHLATKRPELLRSLSLHEPPTLGLLAGDPLFAVSQEAIPKAGALFRSGDLVGGLRVFLSYVGGDWDVIPEPMQEIFLHNAPNYIADWFDDLTHPIWNVDVSALGRFPGPIQLTIGDRTSPTLRAISDKLAALLPEAEVAVIEEAGHGAMMEKPTEYAEALAKFIESTR